MKPRGKIKLAKGAMDLAPVREMIRDSVPATLVHGKVVADQDGEPYRFSASKDVYLDVMTTAGQRLPCRLCGTAGGPGSGVWMVPPVGTEVEVLQEDGRSPRIIGIASSAELPALLVTHGSVSLVIQRKLGDVRIHASQIPSLIDGPATNGNVWITAEGKVYLGDTASTQPAVLGNNLETRLASVEARLVDHTHVSYSSGGETTASIAPGSAVANPAHGSPGHVHGTPEPPTTNGTGISLAGGNILAAKVQVK